MLVNRARPAMGTFLDVEIVGLNDLAVTELFDEATRLQKIFNAQDPSSALGMFNQGEVVPEHDAEELDSLMNLAVTIELDSKGAFLPRSDVGYDLGGIAKGHIVDRLIERCLSQNQNSSGCINAGGDLGFFNIETPKIQIRLGTSERALSRELQLSRRFVCTSSINAFTDPSVSKTQYWHQRREKHGEGSTVVAQADRGAIADALTKVVLFGREEDIKVCCEKYDAVAMTFNGSGELIEVFGEP